MEHNLNYEWLYKQFYHVSNPWEWFKPKETKSYLNWSQEMFNVDFAHESRHEKICIFGEISLVKAESLHDQLESFELWSYRRILGIP